MTVNTVEVDSVDEVATKVEASGRQDCAAEDVSAGGRMVNLLPG